MSAANKLTTASTLAAALWATLLFCAACAAADNPEPASGSAFKIGIIGTFTGKSASRGESIRMGLELAEQELSARSKIKLQLVIEDVPTEQPAKGPLAFVRLADAEHVCAVIGPSGNIGVLPVVPIVDHKGVPTIVHTAGVSTILKDKQFVFRLWPSTSQYAKPIIERAQRLGWKKIAVVSATADHPIEVLEALQGEAQASGISLVDSDLVAANDVDFRAILLRLKKAQADGLFLNLFVGQIGIAARQAAQLGLHLPLLTNPAISGAEFVAGDRSLEGIWYPRFIGYGTSGKQAFIASFGKEPVESDTAAAAHDALLAVEQALSAVGCDRRAIRDYLKSGVPINGISGQFHFLPDGSTILPIGIFTVKNGAMVPAE